MDELLTFFITSKNTIPILPKNISGILLIQLVSVFLGIKKGFQENVIKWDAKFYAFFLNNFLIGVLEFTPLLHSHEQRL